MIRFMENGYIYSKINKLLSFKLSLMRMTTRVTQLKARKQNPSQRGNKSPTQHKQKANYKVNGSQIKLQSKTHTHTHSHKRQTKQLMRIN